MKRFFLFIYSILSYVIFLGVYIYFIFWENNMMVPTGVDFGDQHALLPSVLTNILLIALFFVPHSVMARKSFKQWWTKIIPEVIERSTYILVSSLLMACWVFFWRPIPIVIYDLSDTWIGTSLLVLSFMGFFLTVFCTFLIDHFDLFGLKQVFFALMQRKKQPYKFVTPLLYKLVRHPLYLSFMIVFWSNPILTIGHLLLAILVTCYILIGIEYEERDLKKVFRKDYENYSRHTPKLFPSLIQTRAFLFLSLLLTTSIILGYAIGPIQ